MKAAAIFPAGYTEQEQIGLASIMAEFANPSRGDLDGSSAVAVGNGLLTHGLPCYAHVLTTEIMEDGTIRHCQAIPITNIGHLQDCPQIDPNVTPKPCPLSCL